jgi:hypothetical protein
MELIKFVVADSNSYIIFNMIYHSGLNFTKTVVRFIVHVTMIPLYPSKSSVFWGCNDVTATVRTTDLKLAARQVYCVARNHTCKLCTYYKNYTVFWAIRCTTYGYFFTCGPRRSLRYLVWTFAIKLLENHDLY